MQLSNGLTPAGLHLGHLSSELPVVVISSTIVIIVWAAVAARQFSDLGLMVSTVIRLSICGLYRLATVVPVRVVRIGQLFVLLRLLTLS